MSFAPAFRPRQRPLVRCGSGSAPGECLAAQSDERRGRYVSRSRHVLFTDLVDSTPTIRRAGEELRRRHFEQLRDAIASCRGEEVKTVGDGVMAAFRSPSDAVACGLAIQRAAEAHNHRNPDTLLRVRVGVHVGEATFEEGDYFGLPVVIASRLCSHAKGGQVLVSDVVRALVGDHARFRFQSIGPVSLKGIDEPVAVAVVRPAERRTPSRPRRRKTDFAGRREALTAREREVARLAAEGRTAGEIAEALFIGERTVETHLQNAYAKLGVRTKRELVLRASELGLRT